MSGQTCSCCSPHAEAQRAFDRHMEDCVSCDYIDDGAAGIGNLCPEGERLQKRVEAETWRY